MVLYASITNDVRGARSVKVVLYANTKKTNQSVKIAKVVVSVFMIV